MTETLSLVEILELEITIKEQLGVWSDRIKADILSRKVEGVKSIGDSLTHVVVSFSALHEGVLAAETYVQSAQAQAVANRLSGISTAFNFVNTVVLMAENGEVVLGKHRTVLNNETISALRSFLSEIGA